MAKTKAKQGKSGGNKSAKAAPKKSGGKSDAYEPSEFDNDYLALKQLQARYSALTDDEVSAFSSLISDEDRSKLGKKTKGSGVFRDAIANAVAIDAALTKYPAAVTKYYGKNRFAYLLGRVDNLHTQIAGQAGETGGKSTTRKTVKDAEGTAREARSSLIAKMKGFAGRRAAEKDQLAAASGQTDTTTKLGASIGALATLATTWLAKSDAPSKILAASAGLSAADVTAASDAAKALSSSAAGATLAGRLLGNDSPEVNLAEGDVLHELEEAIRCFDEIHSASSVVNRLIAGPNTRHVLDPKKAAAADAEDPTAGDGTTATGTKAAATPTPPAAGSGAKPTS